MLFLLEIFHTWNLPVVKRYNRSPCPAFQGVLNSFIELDGQHQFMDDPEFGAINKRLRNGVDNLSDIQQINSVCCISPTHVPSPNIPIVVHKNPSRDAINCAMFEDYCATNGQTGH
jgi:hypothetical protein